MANIVLVHGAFGGAWEWRRVAGELRTRGHEVHAITLTGLGDRAHLGGPTVDLGTHVADVIGVLEMEDLADTVLCAHSYGGFVATQVSALAGQRLAATLYLDGLVPYPGESVLDLLPDDLAALMRPQPAGGWAVPSPFVREVAGPMTEALARWYNSRTRPQPIGTFRQPLSAAPDEDYPRGYIRFVDPDTAQHEDFLAVSAQRAASAGWWARDVPGIHDAQVTSPSAVCAAVEEFVHFL